MGRILFVWEMSANYSHLVVGLRIDWKLLERRPSVAFVETTGQFLRDSARRWICGICRHIDPCEQ